MIKIRNRNNRGQVQFFLENVFRLGFLMIALLAFFLLVNFYVVNKIDTTQLEAETVANRIIYSNIIMHNDINTGRVYVGIVDKQKVDDSRIFNQINYLNERHVAVKIKLLNNTPKNDFVKEAYINKAQFERLKVIIDANLGGSGKGGATMFIKKYPVTIKDYNTYSYGTLVLEIIVPNS
jgi:hypothetical protein